MRNKMLVFTLATAAVVACALMMRPGQNTSTAQFNIVGEAPDRAMSEAEIEGLEEALGAPEEMPTE